MYEVEMAERGGVSPRTSPLTSVSSIGSLLQETGFTLPTVDLDTIQVNHCNSLLSDWLIG